MNRRDAIRALTSYADAIKARGATSLFLFGSSAQDSARPDSDLDLFVDYDPGKKFSLVDLVDTVVWRILDQIGLPNPRAYRWADQTPRRGTRKKP